MNFIKEFAKAFVGAGIAGISYLLGVLAPTAVAGDITFVQWLGLALSVLGTFGVTAIVPNKITDAQKVQAVEEVIAEREEAGRHAAE